MSTQAQTLTPTRQPLPAWPHEGRQTALQQLLSIASIASRPQVDKDGDEDGTDAHMAVQAAFERMAAEVEAATARGYAAGIAARHSA